MSSEEEVKDVPIYNKEEQIGRTRADLIYSIRWYLALGILTLILYIFRDKIPAPRWLYIIIPAITLGLAIGILLGFKEEPPRPLPIFVIKPLDPMSARMYVIYDRTALVLPEEDLAPIGTPYGATIRLADEIIETNNRLIVTPSPLHKLAIENPLEALAHIKSLPRLAEQLDEAIARYTELYVSTRAHARQLARRRVSELLQLEKIAEKAAKEELKKSLEGGEKS